MATSKTFFGLRSGSTKSLTFQVVNGKQVTKERVQSVKNPNTRNQIMQRMKLGPALRFYRALEPVLNHSFEGVPYGAKSRQHFLKLAMKRSDGPFMKKGDDSIPYSAYCVATGSLPRFYNDGDKYYLAVMHDGATLSNTTWGDVCKVMLTDDSYKEGDEITYVEAGTYTKIASAVIDTQNNVLLKDMSFVDIAGGTFDSKKFFIPATGSALILSRKEYGVWKRSTAFIYVSEGNNDTPDALVEALNSYGIADESSFGSSRILNRGNAFDGLLKAVVVDDESYIIGVKSAGSKVVKGIFTTSGTKEGFLISTDRSESKTKLSSKAELMKQYPNIWKWGNFDNTTSEKPRPKNSAGPEPGENTHTTEGHS
jgi:hypothetical protein